MLRLIGSEPAAKGIIEADAMPAAIAALEPAVAADEAAASRRARRPRAEGSPLPPREGGVSLRQRAWPMVEMIERCHADGDEIVWGV